MTNKDDKVSCNLTSGLHMHPQMASGCDDRVSTATGTPSPTEHAHDQILNTKMMAHNRRPSKSPAGYRLNFDFNMLLVKSG